MKYEFENIESLIRSAIDPSVKTAKSFDEQFAGIRNAVAVERDRIKKSFASHVWELETNQQRKHYVCYHQQRINVLIDELFVISKPEGKTSGINSRISSEAFFLYDQLDDILNFMQKELSEYFSLDARMPWPQKAKAVKRIQDTCKGFKDLLANRENLLVTICIDELTKLLARIDLNTTYKQVHYAEILTESILDLLKDQEADFSENDIFALLISINFNSPKYFHYYVELIKSQMADLGSDAERLEILVLHNKIINQIQADHNLAYDQDKKGIKTQLSEWISEEIQFLERKRDLTSIQQNAEKDFARKDFKLEFDMSVSQFAFFIKAFIETGVIQNKNVSELIRFLSRFVKTKRSENISYESFRMKYYNTESNTKDSVRNLLHTTIGYINSN